MVFRPTGPYTMLVVNGEQGTGKSVLCRIARALVDPNKAPLRRPPRDDRDLMIAACNGWVVAYDNLSGVGPNLSDALCSLATGGGFATRELYTDDEEKLFQASRPIIINGIDNLTNRSDLLDRAISLHLPPIHASGRKTEAEITQAFDEMQPRLLGALFTAVSVALRNVATTNCPDLPRMADAAMWVTAAEPGLGLAPGAFLQAYAACRLDNDEAVVQTSAVGLAVTGLMYSNPFWEGTAQELLDNLENNHSSEKLRKRLDWPRTPRKLTNDLRRLAPNLREIGINVEFLGEQGHEKKRLIRMKRAEIEQPASPAPPAATLETMAGNGLTGDRAGHAGRAGGEIPPCSKAGGEVDDDYERQERQAMLEFDGGLSPAEAAIQACREIADRQGTSADNCTGAEKDETAPNITP